SITKIETWLKDPYALYAYYVLDLKPLDPLEKDGDAALRGQILHDALKDFITAHPDTLPQNAQQILKDFTQNALQQNHIPAEDWAFYWPRFEKIMDHFIRHETQWRETATPAACEIKGQMTIPAKTGDFILHGRADRIDRMHGGHTAIIDYKTGGQFSKTGIESGDLPQLPLESLIAQNGGFDTISAAPCAYLGYWVLNPSSKNTEYNDPQDLIAQTQQNLSALIETFEQPDTPYFALPRAQKAPRFNDYEHLERVAEWAALDDTQDAA
ncbi:MAG: PD-(D/E)XK nuclease family protein, partial [Bdellovibrionales bacterium]